MAIAKRVTTKNSGRYYVDADDQRYWSVTTILGDGIPKKALTQWAGNESAKYAMQQLAKPLRDIRIALERTQYDDNIDSKYKSPTAVEALALLTDMAYEDETYKSKHFYTSLASLLAHDESSVQVTGYDQIRSLSSLAGLFPSFSPSRMRPTSENLACRSSMRLLMRICLSYCAVVSSWT